MTKMVVHGQSEAHCLSRFYKLVVICLCFKTQNTQRQSSIHIQPTKAFGHWISQFGQRPLLERLPTTALLPWISASTCPRACAKPACVGTIPSDIKINAAHPLYGKGGERLVGRTAVARVVSQDVVQESTGFSPNYLVLACGPLADLTASEPRKNMVDYVNGFWHCRYMAVEVAQKNLESDQANMKKLYDRQTV